MRIDTVKSVVFRSFSGLQALTNHPPSSDFGAAGGFGRGVSCFGAFWRFCHASFVRAGRFARNDKKNQRLQDY